MDPAPDPSDPTTAGDRDGAADRSLDGSRPMSAARLVPCVALAAMIGVAASFPGWSGGTTGADRTIVAWQALFAGLFIAAATAARGRPSLLDALHAPLWLHPWHPTLWSEGQLKLDLAGTVGGSLLLLLLTVGPRRCLTALRRLVTATDQRVIAALLFTPFLWLARFHLPEVEPDVRLDPSWRLAFSYFLSQGMSAGHDFIYTYGPLGFGDRGAFLPDIFWTKVFAWEFGVKVALAAVLAVTASRMRGPLNLIGFLIPVVLIITNQDAYLYLALMSVGYLLVSQPRPTFPAHAAAWALLAVVALTKFTVFVLASGIVGCVVIWAAAARSIAFAASSAALFAAMIAGTWVCIGQPIDGLMPFLQGAAQVAAGYGEAMTRPVATGMMLYGAATVACLLLIVALSVVGRPWSLRRLMAAGVVLGTCFVAFKGGFVRQGGSITFFAVAMGAPFLFLVPREAGVYRRRMIGLLSLVIMFLGFAATAERNPAQTPLRFATLLSGRLNDHWRDVRSLNEQRTRLIRTRAAVQRVHALHKMRAAIGDATVDILGSKQAYVMLNELNWKPRPVFQSYSAYTPYLLELNRAHFAGPDAPEYVIFTGDRRDGMPIAQDDATALGVILRDYTPVLVEHGMLLMRLDRGPAPAEREVLLDRTVAFDEPIDLSALPGDHHVVHIDVEYTAAGKLVSTLFQPPHFALRVKTTDGKESTSRIVPNIWREGVLVNPWIGAPTDWIDWFSDEPPSTRVASLTLLGSKNRRWAVRPEVRVVVKRADDLAPRDEQLWAASTIRYSMLRTPPTRVASKSRTSPTRHQGQDFLLVSAPAELIYEAAPGSYRLTARYAMLERSWDSGKSDGVRFSVVLRTGEEERELFAKTLDPVAVESDRAVQSLELDIDVTEPSQILLRTENGASNAADFAAWSRVHLKPNGS